MICSILGISLEKVLHAASVPHIRSRLASNVERVNIPFTQHLASTNENPTWAFSPPISQYMSNKLGWKLFPKSDGRYRRQAI